MFRSIVVILLLAVSPAVAGEPDIVSIVEDHILPRYETLATQTAILAETASEDCAPSSPALIAAYHDAFDAWVGVSHLRFGPSEQDDRAFALAFWPDTRGSTPKALAALIRDQDPAVSSPEQFADVSIAARGFYALEYLLFDPQFAESENTDFLCSLIKAETVDIARNADAIIDVWQGSYAALMTNPGNDTYRTETEAARQLFTALVTALEFTSDTRLGRPMGTFERPRPKRAEAWRSGRSLRHVILSLNATRDLAAMISLGDAEVDGAFDAALTRAENLNDPVFAGVAEPHSRFRIEVLRQAIDAIRDILGQKVGPDLGIAAGFNSLDGD